MTDPTPAGHEDIPDRDLVDAVRAGDLSAYSALYHRYRDLAARVAWRLAHDRYDAEELVAETFARVLGAIRNGHRPEDFRAYLVAALRHRAYDAYAYRQRHPVLPLDLDLPAPNPECLDPGTIDAVRRAFRALRPRWRAALWLSVVEGDTPAQLAARWKSNANAVAALTFRARRAFAVAYRAACAAR
jgi:RNA polymerase sigma factor (sigma-70 family)